MTDSIEEIRSRIRETEEAIIRHLGLLNGGGAIATLGFAGAMLHGEVFSRFIIVPFFLFAFGAFVLVLGRIGDLYKLSKRGRDLDPRAELFLADDRKVQIGKLSFSLADIFSAQERMRVWARTISIASFMLGIVAGGVLLLTF